MGLPENSVGGRDTKQKPTIFVFGVGLLFDSGVADCLEAGDTFSGWRGDRQAGGGSYVLVPCENS